jgi:hypothetical protein
VSEAQATPDLARDRDLSSLLDDSFRLYRRHLGTLLLVAAAVVLPVELAISGFGLGQLTSGYDATPAVETAIVQTGVALLIVTPLLTAMVVHVVLAAAKGERPTAGRAISSGIEVFTPVLGAILLATVGIFLGFLALIIPGVILAVHWYVVAQAVVVDGRTGSEALRRSWQLVRGRALFVFGVMVLTNLLAALAGAIVALPGEAAAEAADAQAVALGASIVAEILTLPFLAVTGTLLYFTLKVRAGEVSVPPMPAPEPEPQPSLGGWEPPVPPS